MLKLVPRVWTESEMLAGYRESHTLPGMESVYGATCTNDEYGDTRCPLCKAFDLSAALALCRAWGWE